MIQLCNLLELLAKQKVDSIKNGKYGIIGRAAPIPTNTRLIHPRAIKNIRLIDIIFFKSPFLFLAFYHVPDRHDRMTEYHPRSWKTHDRTYFFSHICFVAMYLAIWAKGLGFHKGTLIAPHSCISVKCFTFRAETLFRSVLIFAINADHQRHGSLFPLALGFNFLFAHTYALPRLDRYDLRSPSWTHGGIRE